MYSRRMRNRMFNADRLKRTKQILEATAAISQTVLREVFEPNSEANPAGQSSEPSIEGSFRVVDPEATRQQPSARTADLKEAEVIIYTAPEPDRTGVAPERKQDSSQSAANGSDSATDSRRHQPEVEVTIINSPTPEEQTSTQSPPPSSAEAKSKRERRQQSDSSPLGDEMPFFLRIPEQLRQLKDKIPMPQSTPTQETEAVNNGPGQFLSRSFTNEAGTRSYKVYIPSSYQGQSLPLVVMLHGCTQSPDNFAASTRMNELAETHNFFVAYPAQTFKANFGKCWNWFKAAEQMRDQGEPAIIAGITREVIATYNLDARRVYIAGISAGGAMSMIMGMTYPDLYAATGIHSGVPYGVAQNIPTGLAVIKMGGSAPTERLTNAPGDQARVRVVPTIVFHGDDDSMVNPNNGDAIIDQWMQVRAERENRRPAPPVTTYEGQVPDGHRYTRLVYQEAGEPSVMEQWLVHGAGHAWSGGNPNIAWTDGQGPDASQEMLRFFFEHPHPVA
ncbi:MAG: PHB depolymerase family esterase [Anaerolineae bacterium]|nr:PHB depolymerase family esterase [Anaerolineae bacterium]